MYRAVKAWIGQAEAGWDNDENGTSKELFRCALEKPGLDQIGTGIAHSGSARDGLGRDKMSCDSEARNGGTA